MTQSNEAAERSAHVVREAPVTAWPVVETSPGVWQLRVVADLRAENARLREALAPFACHLGKDGAPVTLQIGSDVWTWTLTTGDFARARAALTPPEPGDG